MTAERRLAKVEEALTPPERVVRWLDEAQAFGSLEDYVRAQLAESAFEPPLDRLAREAAAGARAGARRKGAEAVRTAVDDALRGTVFRFELVLRILVTTQERLVREALLSAVLSAELARIADQGRDEDRRGSTYLERLAQQRDLVAARVVELRAAQAAREAVESGYLAGHPALFADARTAWEQQLVLSQLIANFGNRLAELGGLPAADPPDADAFTALVSRLTADLVEPAKVVALEQLGEGARALTIAARWVRASLSVKDPLAGLTL